MDLRFEAAAANKMLLSLDRRSQSSARRRAPETLSRRRAARFALAGGALQCDVPTSSNEGTAATHDPWNRLLWRGKLVLDTETRQLGMIVTIAPSSTPTADPQQTPIVAFIRTCGRIDKDANRGSTLTAIDNITKCHELPLPQIDLQHSAYLVSPQAQAWQRRANLPILQADADTANTPPPQDTPDPTKRKSPPTAADKLQERQRQRYQIRHLESIVRDVSDMPAQENDTTPVTNVPPTTPTTPARLVLSTSESRTRPREDTADTKIPKKKPRNRKSTGKRKKDTAARNRGRQ